MKPKCFVAMAFGYEDADAVYDRYIKPTIEALGMTARRVDRINHNDDIDDKIIAELDECSVCISDLTYTRPSVYYEAGYARAKGVPVIHTVRADHLDRKAADDRRIHFDLQMKNMVVWSSEKDQDFAKKLKDRLELVSKPILTKRADDAERKALRERFASASASSQIEYLRKVLVGETIRLGFRDVDSASGPLVAKDVGDFWHVVRFDFRPRLQVSDMFFGLTRWQASGKYHVPFLYQTVFICANSVRKATLATRLDDFHPDPAQKRFYRLVKEHKVRSISRPPRESIFDMDSPLLPKHLQEVAFIDAPKSEGDALESLDMILEGGMEAALRMLPDLGATESTTE